VVKLQYVSKTKLRYNYLSGIVTRGEVINLESNQAYDLLDCYPDDWKLVGSQPHEWDQLLGRVPKMKNLRVALPDGIGDVHWTLLKLESLKSYMQAQTLHVITQDTPKHDASDFIKLIPFIDSHSSERGFSLTEASRVGWAYTKDLIYIWAFRGIEKNGNDIYSWLPELSINYDYPIKIPESAEQEADIITEQTGQDPVLFHASWRLLNGSHTGEQWSATETDKLARLIHEKTGKKIVLVGKHFEDQYVKQFLDDVDSSLYINLVGETNLPSLLALIKRSQFIFGYQSGITFLSTHLKTPSALLWGVRNVTQQSAYKWDRRFITSFIPPDSIDSYYFPFVLGEDTHKTVWNKVQGVF